MTLRYYFTDVVGNGLTLATAVRPRVSQVVAGNLRGFAENGSGRGIAEIDVTPAQHTTLLGTAGIVYLPFETGAGAVVPKTSPISAISAPNRALVRSRCEAEGVPDDGIGLADPVVFILRRILKVFVTRRVLGADDLSEGLDTVISAISAAKRQRVRAALIAKGIEFDTVLPTDTVREAKRKIAAQNAGILITSEDER